jgi:hypothetical protein
VTTMRLGLCCRETATRWWRKHLGKYLRTWIAGWGKEGGVIWGAFGVRERLKDPEDEQCEWKSGGTFCKLRGQGRIQVV